MNRWTGSGMCGLLAAALLVPGMVAQPVSAEAASLAAQSVVARAPGDGVPADFPIPDDATVVTAVHNDTANEHFVRLTLQTKLDMETLAKTYSEYFRIQDMPDALQKISEKQLVIQGSNDATGESWILNASPVQPGSDTVEMTLIWNEGY
ncbi:hypothetical protein ACE3MZ_21175 [Paenibacillus sp. WLX1005]|uniref:hypothetical protein n=1 Tax=Paenibacillus sp. WLX1005 TaxID=3243766 RepID=UPI003983E482